MTTLSISIFNETLTYTHVNVAILSVSIYFVSWSPRLSPRLISVHVNRSYSTNSRRFFKLKYLKYYRLKIINMAVRESKNNLHIAVGSDGLSSLL